VKLDETRSYILHLKTDSHVMHCFNFLVWYLVQYRFLKQKSYGDLSPSNRGRLLKMVAAASRHVFDEAICVNFMYIYICFKNVLGIV